MTEEDQLRAREIINFVRDRVTWNRVIGKEHMTTESILAAVLSAMVADAKAKLKMLETAILIAQLYVHERKQSENVDNSPRE